MVGREGGTGGRGPAELDVAVGEATELTVAVAVLPQRAELRLVRRAAARWGQHLAAVEAGGFRSRGFRWEAEHLGRGEDWRR
jgi:cell division GTPase FtsZ